MAYMNFGNIFLCMQMLPFLRHQSARRLYSPVDKTAETQKSRFIFFQLRLNCVPAPAGGYFKLSQNGIADSDGGGMGGMVLPLTVSPSSFTTLSGTGGLSWISKECLSSSLMHTHTQKKKNFYNFQQLLSVFLFSVVWTVAHFSFKITRNEMMKISIYMQKHTKHFQEIYSQIHW